MPKTKSSPSPSSKAGITRKRGFVKPPSARTPAASLPPLSQTEALHERLEERALNKAWEENRLTAPLKGMH